MKLIKIINGTYGFRPQPHFVEAKTPDDPPFEVEDSEAKRLIDLGVAVLAFGEDSQSLQDAMTGVVDRLEDQPAPPEEEPEAVAEEPEEDEDSEEDPEIKFDPEDLATLTNPELSELAIQLGVKLTKRPKKKELIELILKAAEEDNELPELGAADPEV